MNITKRTRFVALMLVNSGRRGGTLLTCFTFKCCHAYKPVGGTNLVLEHRVSSARLLSSCCSRLEFVDEADVHSAYSSALDHV